MSELPPDIAPSGGAEKGGPWLSEQIPWPGLAPFVEADQRFFFGRQTETAELLSLVQREPLTVLFGRSGLGKSSLLKAGLFPRLRALDFLPIYVRLDPQASALGLRRQVFDELADACKRHRVETKDALDGDCLWQHFHRRATEFWSASNRPVTPVFVFDQFEEIFTQGLQREAGRSGSNAFLDELAELVENRPPAAVQSELDRDPAAAASYEFRRSSVKLLLSFREDFLAEMEGLKPRMPSLMYNRQRLLPMDGTQAYAVVIEGGGGLVKDEVARCILRLAWKNEPQPPLQREQFAQIEIDPALLSVVCSELNHKRLQAQPALTQISAELLAGADREILAGFYERSMAGLGAPVRAFVEDELITPAGFRDSNDWEDALSRPGLSEAALNTLIERRLIRKDERLGQRRIELTHDVLTQVIKESRDKRLASAREEELRERERAALQRQRRNRRNSALVAGIAALGIGLTAVASWNYRAAEQLKAQARIGNLIAAADQLEPGQFDTALLVNLEAMHLDGSKMDAHAAMLRRFKHQPYLAEAAYYLHSEPINAYAASPDGKHFASASDDQTIKLWSTDQAKAPLELKGACGPVLTIAFSLSGQQLISGCENGEVKVWDTRKGALDNTLPAHGKRRVRALSVSADGQSFASAGEDGVVIVWDAGTLKPLQRFIEPDAEAMGVAFSPDGRLLASAYWDGRILLHQLGSSKVALNSTPIELKLASAEGQPIGIWAIAFDRTGNQLAAAGNDGSINVWDMTIGPPRPTWSHKLHTGSAQALAFNRDGSRLASGSRDESAILWRTADGTALAKLEGHVVGVSSVVFEATPNSPGQERVITAGWDGSLLSWDLEQLRPMRSLSGHTDAVAVLNFSPDSQRLLSTSDYSMLREGLLGPENGSTEQVPRLKLEGFRLSSISQQNNGTRVAAVDSLGLVTLWAADKATNDLRPVHSYRHSSTATEVSALAFSQDGGRLATAGKDGSLLLIDTGRFRVLPIQAKPVSGLVDSLAFSPDGHQLAGTGKDGEAWLWDLSSGEARSLATPKQPSWLSSLAFSPDGKRLAAAGGGGSVQIWDTKTGNAQPVIEPGHKWSILDLAFSPDGKQLASAGLDRSVILWDLQSNRRLARLFGHKKAVTALAYSPDRRWLASAGKDGELLLWGLEPEALKAAACRVARRNLSCAEWREHVGAEIPYRSTCDEFELPADAESCSDSRLRGWWNRLTQGF